MFVEDSGDESYSAVVKPRFKCLLLDTWRRTLVGSNFEISAGGQRQKELQLISSAREKIEK